ncbi:glycosyltransferase [Curtobacterium citreum]
MSGLIAHDWISPRGGSEKVVARFQSIFPDADLVTLWNDAREEFDARESWIAKTRLRRHKAIALPFMPMTWSRTKTDGYDWVLASSHAFAHHIPSQGHKFVYAHTPARYVWAPEQDHRGRGLVARSTAGTFKRIDRRAISQQTSYAANSAFIARRMHQSWGVDATIIHPPIDVERFVGTDVQMQSLPPKLRSGFVLGASRFVMYKNLDKVIRVGERLDLPVVLAGSGPDEARLRVLADRARVPVLIMVKPSDELLARLYASATMYVFPAIEDFGMMPVEAMASSTPVVVAPGGGARESVELVSGGVVSATMSDEAFARAAKEALNIDMADVPARVERQLGAGRFESQVLKWMNGAL